MPENFTPEQQAQLALDEQQMTRVGYMAAQGIDPQLYADARNLSRSTGQPIDSILRDPKPAQRQQAMDAVNWDSLETVAPTTAKMFRDMDKAKLVGRDLPEFSRTEAAWLSFKQSVDERLFRPVARGANAAHQQWLEFDKFTSSSKHGDGSWQQQLQQRKYAKATAQVNRNIDALPAPASIQQGLSEIQNAKTMGEALHAIWQNPAAVGDVALESLASAAPTIAATIATGGYSRIATGTIAGSGSYLQEYSSTIKEVMQENGVDINDPKAVEEAYQDEGLMTQAKAKGKLRGVAVGFMDGLSTAIAGFAVSGVKGTMTSKLARAITETGTQAAAGGAGEALAQSATGEYQPGAILLEAAAEAPTAPFDIRANYKDAGLYIQARDLAENTVKAAEQAEKAKAQFDKLAEMAKADKVLQRAPELIEEMVQNATQDSGASHIYVSATDLHQSGLAADVAALSPTVAAEIEQATQNGGLIAIPAAEYATRIAPQQWATQFNEHIRETPDAYSAAESANIIKENGAQLKGEFETAMSQISADEAFAQSAGTVKDSILGQLGQLGLHTDAVNDGYATAFAAYYATRAKQMGETPEALFARRPLRWQAQRPDGSGVVADEYDQALGAQPPKGWKNDTNLDFAGRSTEELAAEYAALPDTDGGHIIDTDSVRELSPQYRADKTRSADIHEAASALTKELYASALARPVADGKDAAVLFLAGGGGSGKSFVRQSAMGENTADITVDGTFSNLDRAKGNIEAALASGRSVRIVYVYRPPELAIQGVINRANQEGRPVPIEALAKAHANAPKVVKALAKQYDGNERVNILAFDNSGDGTSFPKLAIKDIPHVNEQNTLNTFAGAFDRAVQSGQISQRLYDSSTRSNANLGTKTSGGSSAGELSQSRGRARSDASAQAGRVNADAAPIGSFSPETFTITLLKGANLSTALHEGAHFFFENDLFIAGQISAQARAFCYDGLSEGEKQILRDASALLKWHGIEGDIAEQLNRWHSLDRDAIRDYHERTAESFERYLLEGKAPSVELQTYFNKFRAWMLSVYASIKQQLKSNPRAGALNDDVRGVFDRMLATNEQIALASQARGMMAMFDSPEAGGMSAAEFGQYQAQGKEATNAAIEQMQVKGLKDMAWLHRTKSKAIKRLGKEATQLRAQYRHDAARQVMGMPVYQAWQFLTRKLDEADKLPAEPSQAKSKTIDPAADSLLDAIAKLGGLSEDETKSLYGVTRKEHPLKDPVFGKPVLRKKGGLSVDAMSQALADYGYLPLNEHEQFDTNDFEERFMSELAGVPQYSIYYNYKATEFRSGDQVPNPMALGAGRLDLGELRAWSGLKPEDVAALQAKRMTATNGLHPDIVTDIVAGFGSGDELLQAILSAKDPHTAIEELVDARMLMEHGELSSPEAIAKTADAAVFNEARLKFAATEANALAKATGGRSVLLAAAKQFAAERMARSTIRNILPGQYAAASARAAKEAQAASKRGDTAGAAAQKRNEVIHSVTTKAAYDALAEVDKAVAYFKRVQQSKTIDKGALAQIVAMLEKYDLRTGQSNKAIDRSESMRVYILRQLKDGNLPDFAPELLPADERAAYFAATSMVDEDGDYIYADDAKRIELLAGMIDASAKTHYKNLSMEQLRGLRENIQQIEHLGKLKNRLLMAKDNRTLDEVKTVIADSIVANASNSGMMLPTRDDLPTRVKSAIKNFATSHIRMAVRAFVIDGGKNNGAFWEHFILPANEASNKETAMTADITAKLSAILDPILKDVIIKERMLKGKFYDVLGTSLNWQNRFSILLNMGNESNTQRLLSGGVGGNQGITLGQLMPVMSEFTAKELRAAQQVWDLFESMRPELAALELATKGKEPEWIPPRTLNIKSKDGEVVTLRGGYFPVVYDAQMSVRAAEDMDASSADLTKSVARATAVTRQSFTKARVEEVHGRPLLLTLDGMYKGLADVIHDLSFRAYAINSSKLLRSEHINSALAEHYGMDLVRELRNFVSELVVGQQGSFDAAAKASALVRKNVALTGLGLNVMNWLQQPFGITNSIVRLGGGKEGAKWVLRGMQHYFANPKAATADAREKSAFMADRGRTRFRELNEIRNKVQVEGLSQRIAPYMMGGMIFMQQIADSITWHGAVAKAIADDPTLPDARLYDIADQVVRDSQGGGQDVDLSEMEKGHPVKKLFTVFFNFMNTGNNLAYLSQNTERSKSAKVTDLLLVYTFPVLLSAIMKGALVPSGDDGEDWEDMDWAEIAKSFAADQASYLISGVFLVREAQMVVKEVFGEGMGFGYSGPTGLRAIPDAYKFAQQAKQGEMDDAFRKAAINLTGDLTGLPSAQTNRSITGAKALAEGETNNPAALVFGFSQQ